MTDDLVKRLRKGRENAADRIEALTTMVEQLTAERDKYEGAWMTAEGKLSDADAMIEAQAKDHASNNIRFAEAEHRAKVAEAERDRLTAQLESTLQDRKLILEERDRTFALMLARAEPTAVQTDAHVNKTPKSEHDTANMLTLTSERDRLAAAVDAVMADRKRILEERDRGFVMVMERAERAEAEVARLTALLPHPGETAQEVMWRNHQRGVRLEELAKAAGVTRERARQMVRKAEMRMGGA